MTAIHAQLERRPIAPAARCGCSAARGAAAPCAACNAGKREGADRSGPATALAEARGAGSQLDDATRSSMERAFGHDFAQVRIFADSPTPARVDAAAYTVDSSIVFGPGTYRPNTTSGRWLLAHELSHVVQHERSGQRLAGDGRLGSPGGMHEREAESAAGRAVAGGRVGALTPSAGGVIRRAMICSKRLDKPVVGLVANHAYIDDTGGNDCLGAGQPRNYAVQDLTEGNFLVGCAKKTDTSSDPGEYQPNKKPCEPKPGVTDVSQCLRAAFSAYANPSYYSNVPTPPWGPNSNTFASTLANACCADSSDAGLGWVPGWYHAPARDCPPTTVASAAETESGDDPGTSFGGGGGEFGGGGAGGDY